MDQSNRYADLSLREEDLIADGRHVLVAYIMKPKAGYGGYLETAAAFRRRVFNRNQRSGIDHG